MFDFRNCTGYTAIISLSIHCRYLVQRQCCVTKNGKTWLFLIIDVTHHAKLQISETTKLSTLSYIPEDASPKQHTCEYHISHVLAPNTHDRKIKSLYSKTHS
jgi:hypothetical protein